MKITPSGHDEYSFVMMITRYYVDGSRDRYDRVADSLADMEEAVREQQHLAWENQGEISVSIKYGS
jgi:hypothetical protein